MDFKFTTQPLHKCAKLLSGGTPSKSNPSFWDGDIPWITPKDMADWNGTTADYVTREAIGKGTRLAPARTSYIAVRGMSLHNEIRVVRPFFAAAFNQDIKAIRALDGINERFLYYCLVAHKQTLLGHVESAGHGTGRLPTDLLENLPIPNVDREVAVSVTKILGDLDDKIDLLRDMNRTLEEIARTLFRAWFTDFAPIRAKAGGATGFRGMPNDIFEALPDSFAPSEKGEKPNDWPSCVLSDLIEVNPTRPLKKKGVGSTYLGMSDVPTAGSFAESWSVRDFTSGMRFQNHDTLLARITPCLENGKTALVDFLADREIGWGSTEFIVLAPTRTTPPEFVYCLARSEDFRRYAIKNMTGTSGRQRVSQDAISTYPTVNPGAVVLDRFGTLVGPMFQRITANRDEIITCTTLRDALLPNLISGEIRAPNLAALGLADTPNGG